MSDPPQTPKQSRSEVAEILLAMSKTPPEGIDSSSISTRTSDKKPRLPSAASSPASNFVAVAKVSNSDDEDMDMIGLNIYRESITNREADTLYARRVSTGMPAALRVSGGSPWAPSIINSSDVSRPQSAPVDSSSFIFIESQCPKTASLARSPLTQSFHSNARNFTPVNGHVKHHAPPPSLSAPDMVDVLLFPSSSFVGGRVARPMDSAIVSPNLQPEPDAIPKTPRNTAREASPAYQPFAQWTSIPPVYMHTIARQKVHSAGASIPVPAAGARVRDNASESHLPRKRAVTPPKDSAAKRARDGFESKDVDITDFKYRTMKVIQMPERNDFLPDEGPPQPTPTCLPYGDEIDYHSSMLLWWLDELELTYTETARRYRAMFAGTTDTDDTVRKKHHVALIRLARRYGLKSEDQIEEPSRTVARRGQQAGHRYNTIGGKTTYAAGAGPDDAGKIRRQRVSEPTADRGFLKACICVWKDTSDVSFALIQQRLAKEYDWHLGVNTVQKMYYDERKRVYDRYDKAGRERSEQLPLEAEEMVETTETGTTRVAGEGQEYLYPAVIQSVDQ